MLLAILVNLKFIKQDLQNFIVNSKLMNAPTLYAESYVNLSTSQFPFL